MPVDWSLFEPDTDAAPAAAATTKWDDFEPEPESPAIKLNPYERADFDSLTAGRGKAATGMEAGTDLLASVPGTTMRGISTLASLPGQAMDWIDRGMTPQRTLPKPTLTPEEQGIADQFEQVRQREVAEGKSPARTFREWMATPAIPFKKNEIKPDDSVVQAAGREIYNQAVALPEFAETPLGLGAAAVSGLGGGALVRAGFLADMAKSMFQQAPALYRNWDTMTPAERTKATVDFIGTGVMVKMLAGHGFNGGERPETGGNPLDVPGPGEIASKYALGDWATPRPGDPALALAGGAVPATMPRAGDDLEPPQPADVPFGLRQDATGRDLKMEPGAIPEPIIPREGLQPTAGEELVKDSEQEATPVKPVRINPEDEKLTDVNQPATKRAGLTVEELQDELHNLGFGEISWLTRYADKGLAGMPLRPTLERLLGKALTDDEWASMEQHFSNGQDEAAKYEAEPAPETSTAAEPEKPDSPSLPPLPSTDTPITVRRPDGTTYEAGFNGWQIADVEGNHRASISKLNEDGTGWTSGAGLGEGEEIVKGDVPEKPEPKPLTPQGGGPPAAAPAPEPPAPPAAPPISRVAAGKALRKLVEADRGLVEQLAANHPADMRLNEDGTRVLMSADSRSRGPGTGGSSGGTTEFINWLMTTKGEGIALDSLAAHMADVNRAREIITGEKPAVEPPAANVAPESANVGSEGANGGSPSANVAVPVAKVEKPAKAIKGRTGDPFIASTPVQGSKVSGKFALVESGDLVTSFDSGYEAALQPRDRTRAASVNQMAQIVQGFDPHRLGHSPTTDLGAPMVDDLNQVLSGNGRTTALRTLYGADKGATYKDWLAQNAKEFGLTPKAVLAMKEPVLVRRVSDFGDIDKVEFARQSNQQQILGMGEAEKAAADSKLLAANPHLLDLFRPDESGNVLAATNREFLNAFIQGTGDQAELLTKDGFNGPALSKRVKNAVLSTFIGHEDQTLLNRIIEGSDELGIKNAVNGTMASAPSLIKFKGTPYDLTANIHQAFKDLVAIKSRGEKLEDFLGQSDLLGDPTRTAQSDLLLKALYEAKSAKVVNEALTAYARQATEALADARSGGMFGDEPATRIQILERVYGKSENPFAAKAENQPVAEPPKPPAPSPEPPRPENPAPAASLFPEATVKQRPLTKAEQNEFGELSLKIKANREANGPQLTTEETQRYEHLTALAGQMDLLSTKVDVSTMERRRDSLLAKADELDRQRVNTQNRLYESKNWEVKDRLVKEAKIYQAEAEKARGAAQEITWEIERAKSGKGTQKPPPGVGPGLFGMGGAVKEEFDPVSQTATGIKNAQVDVERARRGLPAVIQPLRRKFGEVWDRAMAMIDHDPAVIDNLLDSLRKTPRALTDVEDALLTHRQVDLHNEYGKATRDLAQAHDDGRADAVVEEKLRVARLSDQLLDLYNIGKKVGTETGRGLAARKMMVNEDFTLAQMDLDMRSAQGGRPLSEAQAAQIQELHARIKTAQEAYDAYQARMEERLAQSETARVIAEQKAAAVPKFDKRILAHAEAIVSKMEAAAKPAADRLRERLMRMSSGVDPSIIYDAALVGSAKLARATMDIAKFTDEMIRDFGEKLRPLVPQIWAEANKILEGAVAKVPDPVKKAILKADLPKMKEAITKTIKEKMDSGDKDQVTWFVQKLARSLVEHGIDDREELIDEVHKVLQDAIPGITRRDTMDAISGYGDFKQLAKDQISTKLRGMKGEMQQLAKLEDIESRKPPLKSGLERRTPTDEERRLVKQVNDAKRRYGITITDPATQLQSALGARKTALRNQISDLEHEIANREEIVKTKAPSPTDPELESLKKQRDKVQAEHDAMFPREGISEEQKAKLAEASIDRQIGEVQRQLREGDIFKAGQKRKLSTPEIESKRAQLDALKAERQNLRDSIQPINTPEEQEMRKIQQRRIDLQKAITEAERRINTGDIGTTPTLPKAELTAELEAMKVERDQLNQMLTELRAAAKPRRTPEEIARQVLKTRLSNQIADYADRLAREDYSKRPRPTTVMDPESNRLKAESERLKKQFQRGVALERLKGAEAISRGGDWLVKWTRGFMLSGPVTLAKLFSAAVQRMGISPTEEGIGAGIGKIIPGVAAKAPREGGLNVKAEAHAITQAMTRGMQDAWKTLRTGQSDLDVLYGKEALVAPSAVDFFGHVHGALKAPVKRAEFARSFEKRTAQAIASGVDVSDPMVQSRLVIEAYKDANRAIFMQDNRVVTAYKRALQGLEAPDKVTGKVPIGGKVAATTARVLLPIVKVPTNIVAETMEYSTGLLTGSVRLGRAFARGVDTLSPQEADIIMRQLKKGSLGAAALALGYLNPTAVGGYYQPGEKRPKSDVKAGTVRVYGHDVPSFLLHNPLLETIQIGATARRVADSKLRKKDATTQGLPAGLMAAGVGLGAEIPFARETLEFVKAFDPKQQSAFYGELAKSRVVPQLIQSVAKYQDKDAQGEPVQRKPGTVLQHIETGIPYLRQNVPWKDSRGRVHQPAK